MSSVSNEFASYVLNNDNILKYAKSDKNYKLYH